ncbi:MAG: DUF192 domain-containing protein [Parcubacteria group bacterium]|jgi:hypothetical protein
MMKKNKIILGALFILIILLSGGIFYWKKMTVREEVLISNNISLGNCNINIETVATDELREKGLAGRDSLCQNCGMLFLFDKKEKHYFWMKGMRFSIDMVWLVDNKVVDINKNINQQSKKVYSSKEKVNKVLELNAHDADRCGIKIGDKLK